MGSYIVQRLAFAVPVMLLVSVMIFAIVRLLPGDAALVKLMAGGEGQASQADVEALREQLGLNRPMVQQYADWMGQLLRLDLGASFFTGRPVRSEIAERFPRTLELALLTIVVAVLIALPLGTIAAVRQGSIVDQAIRIVTVGGIAAPTFWVGTLIILLLVWLVNWIPPIGYVSFWDSPITNLQQVAFPSLALGYNAAAVLTRLTRSAMLEVLRQDYVRTARAKGVRETIVLARHALPNAGLPLLTLIGIQFTTLLGGSVIAETIFVLPGLGSLLVESILRRDYFVTQGIILTFALMVVMSNLIVDVLYRWVDPRVAYS